MKTENASLFLRDHVMNLYTYIQPLTLQREVTSAARHGENIICRGVTSTARHAAHSHSFDYISTT